MPGPIAPSTCPSAPLRFCGMSDTTVDGFRQSLLSQVREFELVDPEDPIELALGEDDSGVFAVAATLLAEQAVNAQSEELCWLLCGGDDVVQEVLRSAGGKSLLLAFFILGRKVA